MAKKISFNELCNLVANIDYAYEDSYPIVFSVKNKGDVWSGGVDYTMKHECGITGAFIYQDEVYDEYQYLVTTEYKDKHENKEIRDKMFLVRHLVNPDDISFNEIRKVLKDKCRINKDSVITFYEGQSFNGRKGYIDNEEVTEEFCVSVTQGDITEEVKKGIDWFKELLKTDVVLFSTTKRDFAFECELIDVTDYELTNINEMSGDDFADLFNKKKLLYYDVRNHVLCTYAPTYGRELKEFYTRIECNDNLIWVLLYICTGEDFRWNFRSCDIEIRKPHEEPKYIIGINQDKIRAKYNELYATASALVSMK